MRKLEREREFRIFIIKRYYLFLFLGCVGIYVVSGMFSLFVFGFFIEKDELIDVM